ncbi:MAG TPA: signal peptidase II [Bryobacteraceae bacterium]
MFALDRISKWLIETHVSFLDSLRIIPGFFDIVHTENRGVAFSLFNDSTSEWRTLALVLFSIAAVVLVGGFIFRRADRLDRFSLAGFALILGGALGNVFDRIVWGRVTDFLDFYIGSYHWPAFNVADSAIVIGSALLLIEALRPRRQAANVP